MYEGPVQDLIDQLGSLPGIGPKGAQRIAFYLLDAPSEDVSRLAEAIVVAKQKMKFCQTCFNITTSDSCRICSDPRRDPTVICVVEESKDVIAIERTREFRGRYHVLGGAISPIDGRGPNDLRIRELLNRLSDMTITEVILATNPNLEGEATATYLQRLLVPLGITVSKLASGLPVGSDLEYADEVTLGRAFAGRRDLGQSRTVTVSTSSTVERENIPESRQVDSPKTSSENYLEKGASGDNLDAQGPKADESETVENMSAPAGLGQSLSLQSRTQKLGPISSTTSR